MYTNKSICALALLLLAPWAATQALNLPTPSIANSPGISIHFTRGNTTDLDMMAAAGIKTVRTDFVWRDIETQKGVYNWAAYDELVNNLVRRGMRPYFILDYSNPLYEDVHILSQNGVPYAAYIDSPNSPDSMAAFAAWAKVAAIRYQSKNVIWEIWNEPNLVDFWKPTPNVGDYTTLSKTTCDAIHSAVPSAQVVGGATSGMAWDFLYAYLGSGVLSCIDAVSVHPYRGVGPETVSAEVFYLQWVIDQYAPSARVGKIPLISGEWGYPTQNGSYTLDYQAAYAVRMQLNNLLNNIPISIWYDWKNDGTDPTNREHNWGIVTSTLSPKPAYYAMKTLSQQLAGYTLVSRITTGNDQDYVLLFANAQGKKKAVAWTISWSDYATTILPQMTTKTVNTSVPVVNMTGTNSTALINASGMAITLSFTPQYIDLSKL